MATPYGSVNNQAVVMNMKGVQNIDAYNTHETQPWDFLKTSKNKPNGCGTFFTFLHSLIAIVSSIVFLIAIIFWRTEIDFLKSTDEFPAQQGQQAWQCFSIGLALVAVYNTVSALMWIFNKIRFCLPITETWPEREDWGFLIRFLIDSLVYWVAFYFSLVGTYLHNFCPTGVDTDEKREKCVHAAWYFYSQSRLATTITESGELGCEVPYLSVQMDGDKVLYQTSLSPSVYSDILAAIAFLFVIEFGLTSVLLPCIGGGGHDVPFYILPIKMGSEYGCYGCDEKGDNTKQYKHTSRFLSAFRMWYTVRKIFWTVAFFVLWGGLSNGMNNSGPMFATNKKDISDNQKVPGNLATLPSLVPSGFEQKCRMYPGVYFVDHNESSTGPLLMNYTGESVLGWSKTKKNADKTDEYLITLHMTENKIPFSAASCAKGGKWTTGSKDVDTKCASDSSCKDSTSKTSRRLEEAVVSVHVTQDHYEDMSCGGNYNDYSDTNDQFHFMNVFWWLFFVGWVFDLVSNIAYTLAIWAYNVQPVPEANQGSHFLKRILSAFFGCPFTFSEAKI